MPPFRTSPQGEWRGHRPRSERNTVTAGRQSVRGEKPRGSGIGPARFFHKL